MFSMRTKMSNTQTVRLLWPVAACACALVGLSGCVQKPTETWNSYYYGAGAGASSFYNQGASDNDATYELPAGFGSNDQDQAAQYYYQQQQQMQRQQRLERMRQQQQQMQQKR